MLQCWMIPPAYVRALRALKEYLVLLTLPLLVLVRVEPLPLSEVALHRLYQSLIVFE